MKQYFLTSPAATMAGALLALVALVASLVSFQVITTPHALGALAAGGFAVFGMATALQNDDYIKYLIAIGFLDAGGGPKFPRTFALTANTTLTAASYPSGSLITNRGASGSVTVTLPAPAQGIAGTYYTFLVVAAQVLAVATATADTLITDNDATADSLQASRLGTQMNLFCDGTSWIASISGVPQSAFAQVGTVNT